MKKSSDNTWTACTTSTAAFPDPTVTVEFKQITIYERICRFIGEVVIVGFCLTMVVLWFRTMGLTLW